MQPDPVRIDETRAWITKAAKDLRAAAHDLLADPPLLDDVVFHCQQAAEKSLKGFLVWHDHPFRKTHSLEEIGEQCLQVDQSLKPLVDEAVPLTQYAWEFTDVAAGGKGSTRHKRHAGNVSRWVA